VRKGRRLRRRHHEAGIAKDRVDELRAPGAGAIGSFDRATAHRQDGAAPVQHCGARIGDSSHGPSSRLPATIPAAIALGAVLPATPCSRGAAT
jgi:hypothetical protein